jgi:hypothetical protein
LAGNGKFGKSLNAILKASTNSYKQAGGSPQAWKEIKMSKNRLFNIGIVLILALVLLITIREGVATSNVIASDEEIGISQRGLEAESARWALMAEAANIQGLETLDRQRAMQADADRWAGQAAADPALKAQNTLKQQRSLEAYAERWTSMSEHDQSSLNR